jgi:3-methyladenine DNA glycosylase AlkD
MAHAKEIRTWIHSIANPTKRQSEAIMGTKRVQLGIRNPDLRAYTRDFVKANKEMSFEDWRKTLDTLYHGASMEERFICGMFLAQLHDFRRQLSFETLEHWLEQLEGWAEIDNTCQSSFQAKDLLANWESWQTFLRKLAQDNNINKRRASLVLLKKSLADNADLRFLKLALEQVDKLKHEKDKLITKAISWILRTASKHHHAAITTYLDTHENSLPRIAVRETRKKLATGTK